MFKNDIILAAIFPEDMCGMPGSLVACDVINKVNYTEKARLRIKSQQSYLEACD